MSASPDLRMFENGLCFDVSLDASASVFAVLPLDWFIETFLYLLNKKEVPHRYKSVKVILIQ
ncbi:hypothetical protein VCRA2133E348_940009 [Vibrio crassostreae]|nr:hypothetical protein VCRA2133E348_940009 [Vibrio crassostreae]CAK3697556.1 hypothetical protein VCRA213O314_980009 [Vibrio crassostreae]